jgi:hypothetical protein
MKKFLIPLLFLALLIPFSAAGPELDDYSKGRFNNVCKDLKGDILVYYIFIDTKTTSNWAEFDIISTIDSMNIAIKWIENQAAKNNIPIKIKSDYYIGKEFATINRNLPNGTVEKSLGTPNIKKGTEELNKWSDYVARKAGESYYIAPKDGIPAQQAPKTTERLIAHLRDEYNVESVALLFMVNNYYRSDISIALNTFSNDFVEYAIVSYKYPSEIVHNILHLYGASDLYRTAFRKSQRKIKLAAEFFPNDIMQEPYAKNLNELEIGDFTRYLIGWTNDLDPRFVDLLK